jgi:hypothetical protein
MSSRKRTTIHTPQSLKNKIETFSQEIMKWRSEGYELVSKERHDRRMDCCKRCEFYRELPIGGYCSKCGCYSVKLWLKTSSCPINKW